MPHQGQSLQDHLEPLKTKFKRISSLQSLLSIQQLVPMFHSNKIEPTRKKQRKTVFFRMLASRSSAKTMRRRRKNYKNTAWRTDRHITEQLQLSSSRQTITLFTYKRHKRRELKQCRRPIETMIQ